MKVNVVCKIKTHTQDQTKTKNAISGLRVSEIELFSLRNHSLISDVSDLPCKIEKNQHSLHIYICTFVYLYVVR